VGGAQARETPERRESHARVTLSALEEIEMRKLVDWYYRRNG
jgi:hypothetical protein